MQQHAALPGEALDQLGKWLAEFLVFAMVVATRGQDEGSEAVAAVTPFVGLGGSSSAGVANMRNKQAKSWQTKELDAVNAP